MMENVVPAGGQGAVEFDDSSQAGSVESRLSLVRALAEDIAHSGEQNFAREVTVDDRIWRIQIEQVSR